MTTLHDHIWNGTPVPPELTAQQERPAEHVRAAIYAAAHAALPAPKVQPLWLPAWRAVRAYTVWATLAAALFLMCTHIHLRDQAGSPTDMLAQALVSEWQDGPLAEECGVDDDDMERQSLSTMLAWMETDLVYDTFQLSYNH